MKNIFKITLIASLLTVLVGCETGELDLLESPNNITVGSADPNFVLNDIQLNFRNSANRYAVTSMALTRMINQFGSYNNVVDNLELNGTTRPWFQSYQMFSNIDLLGEIDANDPDGIPNHIGMAQVLEAYAYMLLVDFVGDVPYSQAVQPEEFPNPVADSGAEVYAAQIALLDDAIANLSSGSLRTPEDQFYGDFNADNWIALANSLKIRAYLNMRLVDPAGATAGINAAASQNIIDTTDEDFQFQYGTTLDPESRHPYFTGNYLAAGAATYMSNYLYDIMNVGDDQAPFVETGNIDPRARYYFYRQRSSAPSGSDLPCVNGGAIYDYCYVGNLYWGRDHTDDEGLPNDATKRTTYGVYPAGGAFDRDLFEQARAVSESLDGEGIMPYYLASTTHFALAEAALTLGTAGNPATLLEQGMRLSMNKVRDFAAGLATDGLGMTDGDINAKVAETLAEFNAGTTQQKLAVIAREWLIASYGNGTEPYNTYRRTGEPNLQSPIIAAGPFPRVWSYPSNEVINNPNINQQTLTTQVFWDNNPANFID